MDDEKMPPPIEGRGAISNRSGRYERLTRAVVDDGWGGADDDPPRLRTNLTAETARTIITRNASPDVPFDRSVNPYRGCEHGCIYCFARPTHARYGLSPGLDFESVLFFKPNAPELLDKELRARTYVPAPIALSPNTDPYQPAERGLGLTRRILEVLDAFGHPVSIITKSALILRDRDILGRMASRGLVQVALSVTTLDRTLARCIEPRAASPDRRLETVRSLREAGVPTAVLVSPLIPGLTDHELERILEAAAEAGAQCAATTLLRLPYEVGGLFEEWLAVHAPERANRVLSLLRQCRGGHLDDARPGRRMTGDGPYARLIRNRYHRAAERLGLDGSWLRLTTEHFRRPPAPGDQLSLFD